VVTFLDNDDVVLAIEQTLDRKCTANVRRSMMKVDIDLVMRKLWNLLSFTDSEGFTLKTVR